VKLKLILLNTSLLMHELIRMYGHEVIDLGTRRMDIQIKPFHVENNYDIFASLQSCVTYLFKTSEGSFLTT
jgi:hypothetical protein